MDKVIDHHLAEGDAAPLEQGADDGEMPGGRPVRSDFHDRGSNKSPGAIARWRPGLFRCRRLVVAAVRMRDVDGDFLDLDDHESSMTLCFYEFGRGDRKRYYGDGRFDRMAQWLRSKS
jgi:hypothetical protein